MDIFYSAEMTIFFTLPLKLFVVHTTRAYPTVQCKWTAMKVAGEKKNLYSNGKSEINKNV